MQHRRHVCAVDIGDAIFEFKKVFGVGHGGEVKS
jgi:hypothetical protein